MTYLQKLIVDKILEYEKISIFFHEVPDFDVLGACYATKNFIKTIAPQKEVMIIGLDILDDNFSKNFFEFDKRHVPNRFISESLGIILDTANAQRIWSGRHKYCKELIRIDHHPQVESIANIEWIDSNYPATCEMMSELFLEWDPKSVNKISAMYLYAGIVTDTNRFLYLTTRPSTFEIVSKLTKTNFDRQKLNDIVYSKTLKENKFDSYVINRFKYYKNYKFGYSVLGKNSFQRFGIDLRMSMVHVFNNTKGLEVWMSIYYDDTVKAWRGSLRSKSLPINQIAEKHHGGGHKLASGFTLISKNEYKKIRNEVIEYLKQYITND